MRIRTEALVFILAAAGGIAALSAADAVSNKSQLDKKLAAIVNYKCGMSAEAIIAVEKLIRESQADGEQRKYIEQQMAGLLKRDISLESKEFICRQLWFIGTAESVPAIAGLLTDEKTADMACYAIGQNPSPQAAEALRDAMDKVSPSALVRIVNLLGDRRDEQSAEAIGKLVFGAEREVAEAAVAAMGKIGGAKARVILAQARAKGDEDLRFAATDAYLRCAEELVIQGDNTRATVIYRELADKAEAAFVRSAAIKGLADIGGSDVVPPVAAALRDEERMVRTTARGCVRTMKGQGVTAMFAAELPKMSPAEQVYMLDALANRQDSAALPAVAAALGSANEEVQIAALYALALLGDVSSVELLVKKAGSSESAEEKRAAVFALANIKGEGVNDAIVKSMQNSQPAMRAELIGVLYDRNAAGAADALLKEATNADAKVGRAAFKALAKLAGEKYLPEMIKLLLGIQDQSGRRDAERAAVAVARKISDEPKRADLVLSALDILGRASAKGSKQLYEQNIAARSSLLRVLGGIANSKALEAVRGALKDKEPRVADAAVRALAGWPDSAAAEALLGIYRSTKNPVHRGLALRGCVRLLTLDAEKRDVQETLIIYGRLMSDARNAGEKRLVLSGLSNVTAPEALEAVRPYLEGGEVMTEAALALVRIAGSISQGHPKEAKAAAQKVLAVSTNDSARQQAQEVLDAIK